MAIGPVANMLSANPLLAQSSEVVDNLNIFDPVSPPAIAIRNLFLLVLAVTGVIFVLVEGLLIWCLWRFRRGAGPGVPDPPQIYGSVPIEVAWTMAPLLVVFVMFLVVVRTVAEVRPREPPPDSLCVTVIGHQWWWEFQYFDGPAKEGVQRKLLCTTANELHIPVDRPIALDVTSMDVVHSFWVPRLAGKTDTFPDRMNHMWFQALQAGIYHGQCAEYCGTQHANMLIRVVAEPKEDYEKWLKDQVAPAVSEPSQEAGRKVFLSMACVNCHRVRGTPADGTFGPDLTHLMSRKTLAARTIANDRENLTAWIKNPDDLKPGCNMPSLHLSEQQIREVVAYLETLR